jgi:ring-1,2-phenylacetyl-CoA epoxidase subunit PaaC
VDRDDRRAPRLAAHRDRGVSEEPSPPDAAVFESAVDAEAAERAVAAAAPVVQERADVAMVSTLDPALREPMRALLASLADNKYLLGRRYAEWCTGAPKLESAVAAAAMAQDELGHARSFYPLLRGFGADAATMEEKGWQERPTNAVACLDRGFERWSDFIAANVVLDSAFTTLFESALESKYEPLRQRARKIVQEESAHWVHGGGWLRRLRDAQASLEAMWDDALTWYGQADDPMIVSLAAGGLLSHDPVALRDGLRSKLQPLLAEVGMEQLLRRELPWSRWDLSRRRLSG